MTTKTTNTIALIPAYNEEATIADVINKTKPFVNKVLVINDGSTDTTKQAGAEVVDNIVNRGLGPTMKRGYEEALKEGADIIFQLDADGQYLAKEIPLLIQPILENEADLVLGSRLKNITNRRRSIYRQDLLINGTIFLTCILFSFVPQPIFTNIINSLEGNGNVC